MPTRCVGNFSVTWMQKHLLSPVKIRILTQKRLKLAQNMHIWSFWPNIGIFGPSGAMPDQIKCEQSVWVGFTLCGSSPFKIRILAQKRPNLAQNWHFSHFWRGLAGSFGALLVGWLVVVTRGLYLARHLFTLY